MSSGCWRNAGSLQGSNLYDIESAQVVHHVNQALKAIQMFRIDTDYIVKDEGRDHRRIHRPHDGLDAAVDGLHQAVQAKEGAQIEPENQTLASITFQNYFRMYPKLSGMTGMAATEVAQLFDIYKMNVDIRPTVRSRASTTRMNFTRISPTSSERLPRRSAKANERAQPVRPPCRSKSQSCCCYLEKEGVAHSVLNARFHESEAHIVAQAGRTGAVTIATTWPRPAPTSNRR